MRGQVKVYQKKIVDKRRRRIFYFSFYSIVLVGLVVSGLSYLTHIDSMTISEVSVRGNVRVGSDEVERIVNAQLVGNYAGMFARSNALLYPQVDIEEKIAEIPLVKKVEVSRSGFNTVVVHIEERNQVARWCNEGVLGEETCFSLDEEGFIFGEIISGCGGGVCAAASMLRSVESSPFTYRGIIGDNPLGKNILPSADFKNIQFFIHQMEGLSVDPIEAELSSTTDYMTIMLGAGGKIIVNTSDDLSATLENISAVLKDRSVAPSFSDFLAKLDYIKFDAGNKVVYKLRATTSDNIMPTR